MANWIRRYPLKINHSEEGPAKVTDGCRPIASFVDYAVSIVIWIAPAATGRTIQVSVTERPVARTRASAYMDNCPPCSLATCSHLSLGAGFALWSRSTQPPSASNNRSIRPCMTCPLRRIDSMGISAWRRQCGQRKEIQWSRAAMCRTSPDGSIAPFRPKPSRIRVIRASSTGMPGSVNAVAIQP